MAVPCEHCSRPRYPDPHTECLFGRADKYPWPFSASRATEILADKGREALQDYVVRRVALYVSNQVPRYAASAKQLMVCLYHSRSEATPAPIHELSFMTVDVFIRAYLSRIHESPALREQREAKAAACEERPVATGVDVWTIARWFQTAPIPVYILVVLDGKRDEAEPLSSVTPDGHFYIIKA